MDGKACTETFLRRSGAV